MSAVLCGTRASEFDVRNIETPLATRTYQPVAYGQILDHMYEGLLNTPWKVSNAEYSLGREGSQLFGIFNLEDRYNRPLIDPLPDNWSIPGDAIRPSIGFRSSHDKSISIGIVVGASVFVCDNMMFNTDGFHAIRKHTKNVFNDIEEMIQRSLSGATRQYNLLQRDRWCMKNVPVDKLRGYEILGHAYGDKILTSQQFTSAAREWEQPSDDFYQYFGGVRNRNAWSLYNAMTYGLKKGSTQSVINRYMNQHNWFIDLMGDDNTYTWEALVRDANELILGEREPSRANFVSSDLSQA